MRHTFTTAAFLIALLAGCGSPAKVARREINRVATLTVTANAGFRAAVDTAAQTIAADEQQKRRDELTKHGCELTSASQPFAPAECQSIWGTHLLVYQGRIGELQKRATQVDAAIKLTLDTLSLAIKAVGEVEAGIGTVQTMNDVVARCTGLLVKLLAVYADLKTFLLTITPLPSWM